MDFHENLFLGLSVCLFLNQRFFFDVLCYKEKHAQVNKCCHLCADDGAESTSSFQCDSDVDNCTDDNESVGTYESVSWLVKQVTIGIAYLEHAFAGDGPKKRQEWTVNMKTYYLTVNATSQHSNRVLHTPVTADSSTVHACGYCINIMLPYTKHEMGKIHFRWGS